MMNSVRVCRPKLHKGKYLRGFRRRLERGLAIIGFFFIVYHLFFEVTIITSDSMAPTLRGDGLKKSDRVLMEKPSYWFRRPQRWEVIAFLDQQGNRVMKRVVGLPGESVSLSDGQIVIDESQVHRPGSLDHLYYHPYGSFFQGRNESCDNGYYILGDHSRDSQDSRFEGPLHPDRIRGRAWLRIWPLARIGFVNP